MFAGGIGAGGSGLGKPLSGEIVRLIQGENMSIVTVLIVIILVLLVIYLARRVL
ncbi:hypothetical protein BH10ACT11_BH10ACT11_14030 [soil metagenome]